jgi:23S rRNA (adenine2030-N6)-methyltransferase
MLGYQHGYHAGNFADVIKHLALIHILSYSTIKEKPLFYLETHAGKGMYHLRDKQAQKTGEYKQGINLVWEARSSLPPSFEHYMRIISHFNPGQALTYYPGSPAIALECLRPKDRLCLYELHPNEYDLLTQLPKGGKKVHFYDTDGISSLKAQLPPPEKRGLVFIDPSYELQEEYKLIPLAISKAYAHFSQGVYCLWYPIVNRRLTDKLQRHMSAINTNNFLNIEFQLTPSSNPGMTGCGLWVINPPYTLEQEMKSNLETLCKLLNPGISTYTIIKPEIHRG